MVNQLPDEDAVSFSYGTYISMLHKSGSYHWYSSEGTVPQIRDYVWDLMDLVDNDFTHSRYSSSAKSGALEFVGIESSNGGSVITCFWKNETGADRIMRAVQREWDGIRAKLERGVCRGLPWNTRNTIMMFGEIDPQQGLPELYNYLEDGELVSLASGD